MDLINLEKRKTINIDTIVIDGFWGCGKSLLFNLLPAFKNVLRTKNLHDYEYIFILRNQKLVSHETAKWYIQNLLDFSIYKASIGRETNLRWSDDSGLKNSLNIFKEIKLLFSKEGDEIIKEIEDIKISQSIFTHNLGLCEISLKELALPNIFFFELIRNPIFIFKHYEQFLNRYDSAREFTPSFYHKEIRLPWFTFEYKENLESINISELAIVTIINSYKKYFKERKNYLDLKNYQEICFEELIFKTEETINKIEIFIGREKNERVLKNILKKMQIPRDNIFEGLKSGTERLNKNSTKQIRFKNDKEYCQSILNEVSQKTSKDLYQEFINIIYEYQENFPYFDYSI